MPTGTNSILPGKLVEVAIKRYLGIIKKRLVHSLASLFLQL